MVVFDKQKYACLSCIRGHRSSSCEHRDRILLQVRKPGRKSLSEPRSRFALVRKEQSPTSGANCCGKAAKASEFKLVRVPSLARADADVPRSRPKPAPNGGGQADSEDDDVVLTEKFVFVHVGDNLYRRELRPDTLPPRLSPSAESQAQTPVPEYADELAAPAVPAQDVLRAANGQDHLGLSMQPPIDPRMAAMPARMNGSMNGSMNRSMNGSMNGSLEPHMNSGRRGHEEHLAHGNSVHMDGVASPGASAAAAPLVIAPMSVHNNARNSHSSSDILHELGLTTEEAEQLWPGAFDSGADLSYASQCVMPGQCECGDSCACPDCYEHNPKHRGMRD